MYVIYPHRNSSDRTQLVCDAVQEYIVKYILIWEEIIPYLRNSY